MPQRASSKKKVATKAAKTTPSRMSAPAKKASFWEKIRNFFFILAISALVVVGGYTIFQDMELQARVNGDREREFTLAETLSTEMDEKLFTADSLAQCTPIDVNSDFSIGGLAILQPLNEDVVTYQMPGNNGFDPNPYGYLRITTPSALREDKRLLQLSKRGGVKYPYALKGAFKVSTVVKAMSQAKKIPAQYKRPANIAPRVITTARLRITDPDPGIGNLAVAVYSRANKQYYAEFTRFDRKTGVFKQFDVKNITEFLKIDENTIKDFRLSFERKANAQGQVEPYVYPLIEILDDSGNVTKTVKLEKRVFTGAAIHPQVIVKGNWQIDPTIVDIDDFRVVGCNRAATQNESNAAAIEEPDLLE
jgi:hypothetical protein